MNPSSEREEHLFAEALGLPASERAVLLARVGAVDPMLRGRVETLLAAHETPGSVLGPPAAALVRCPEEQPGDRIGRYRLLQKIGEGGCGVVYMADQQEPVHRRVALKVIKLGMDTKEVIARFEAERQALALMDHPHIARVFDAGATAGGRPYFVMELVRGVRITDFCDGHSVSTAQRLELFIQVCRAVQHAHQKGIIHRDLKPSNILVTINDGVPVPKIIDFGIAKATQGRLTDQTVFTAFEQFIGTPTYMSPEQAVMTSLDIDTRSDIYSLGVLLYELLTGRTPFDAKALLQAGLEEVRRLIREVEPPKPSSRLSTMEGKTLTLMAQRRHTEPPKLISLVRGDLDWIVMKAIEKDRGRRYETPTALAADLARHLRHEPVGARPPSTAYRAGRFIRRHRLGFAATVSVALALVAGMIVSHMQAVRAERAERRANVERSKTEAERARSEKLVIFILGDLRSQLERVGQLDIIEGMANKLLEYFASQDSSDLTDTTLTLHTTALTHSGGLEITRARYAEAEQTYAAAYARAAELARRYPRNSVMLFARGQVEFGIGHVHYRRAELEAARAWFGRYRDTATALVALDPKNPLWQRELAYGQHNLAVLSRDEGQLEAARNDFLSELTTLNTLLAATPTDLELKAQIAEVISFLGSLAERSGDFPESLRRYGKQVGQTREIVAADSKNPRWRHKLSESLGFQATLLALTGRLAEARPLLAESRQLLIALVAHDATNQRWRSSLWVMNLKEATHLLAEGNPTEAFPLVESTRNSYADLVATKPTDRKSKSRLANAWRVEATVRHALKRDDAVFAAGQAVALGESFLAQGRASPDEVGEFAQALLTAGAIAAARGDSDAAQRYWQRAREMLAPLLPPTRDWRLLDPAARAAALTGGIEEARTRISQLTQWGYLPLEPWPNPDDLGAAKNGEQGLKKEKQDHE